MTLSIILNPLSSLTENRNNINHNFHGWFGESVARTEDGEPIVFYHATKSDFSSFKKVKSRHNNYSTEIGFFFTPDLKTAHYYGNDEEAQTLPEDEWEDSVEWLPPEYHKYKTKRSYLNRKKDFPMIKPVYLRIENPIYWETDFFEKYIIDQKMPLNDLKEMMKFIKEDHDGIIIGNEPTQEWVVFKPNQVKSIYNKGTWNTASNNLSESKA